ncbi:hypothetical protein APR50_10605 [Variovorax paradoxus]|uniref:hypothetical protein n=1 Tax=Variovorax paradoxus TaxID=34073 RepID=UPI0006E700D5|nr:hypothetical protein APR50_10605 [Variovorax paradoxus]KPV11409.1 hypothetical protein APR49_09480 [Variovorax paradoxus]KPV31132.1 hypothetical protein APR48_17545 [Variovorax paradoxus]KPV33225.1 hypothetical protein APR47_17930 [Variovorax paradoxus]
MNAPNFAEISRRPMPECELQLSVDLADERRGWKVGRNFFGRSIDKTSDAGDREHKQRASDARAAFMRDLSATQLGDIACDDDLLAAVRTGNPVFIGARLMSLVDEAGDRAACVEHKPNRCMHCGDWLGEHDADCIKARRSA